MCYGTLFLGKAVMNKGRPPVGGYGIKSEPLKSTIRLPIHIYLWIIKKANIAKFVREIIIKAHDEEQK